MRKTKRKLGTPGFINGIIRRCEIEFRRRGFNQALDQIEDYIGVGNGVLQLFPHVELIQRYHEIPISRYTKVDYIPYDENNPIIKETEEAIMRLFATPEGEFDEETYNFVMMYFSTALHGRKKEPKFALLLGEGSAGKTTLADLQTNVLGVINNMHPGEGYGNSIDPSFFTTSQSGRSGGPDTEKVSIKHARCVYSDELDEGDVLYMGKIKRLTGGGVIGANDKNKKHETFTPKCIWMLVSNYEPGVKGSDYAAWRRLLKIVFRRRFMDAHNYDPNNPLHYLKDKKWADQATKDPAYLSAYLSILVKMHEKLQYEYGGDINLVPKTRIDYDTKIYQNEQDVYSRFISERVVHIGPVYPGTSRKPKLITMDEITQKFRKWFVNSLDTNVPPAQEIHKHIKQTILSKYESKSHANAFLIEEHVILEPGEIFDLNVAVEKIKREESDERDMSNLDDSVGSNNPDDVEPPLPPDDLDEKSEPVMVSGSDNFDIPNDLSDLEDAFVDDLSDEIIDDLSDEIIDDLSDEIIDDLSDEIIDDLSDDLSLS